MKDTEVVAIMYFKDLTEQVDRKIGDTFYCTKERAEFLKNNKAVEILEKVKTVDNIVEKPKKKTRKKNENQK